MTTTEEQKPVRSVLVVDDVILNRKLAMVFLNKMGWKTFEADGGHSALNWLGSQPAVDLVLLDPPFEYARMAELMQAATQALAPSGYLYLEAPRAWSDDELGELGLLRYRDLRAGAVHAHLLRLA